MHGACNQLRRCVWVARNDRNLLVLFNVMEQQFWSIVGEKIGSKHLIVVPHQLITRLAVRCLQLSQDELNAHRWVPSNQIRVIRNLEMIVDVFIKHLKTCPVDINVGEVIIPCVLPHLVQRLYHLRGHKLGIIWHVTWIWWNHKESEFDQQVHG